MDNNNMHLAKHNVNIIRTINNRHLAKRNPQTITICTLPKSLCSKVRSVTSAQTFKAFLISKSTSLLVNLLVEGFLEILQVSCFVFHLEPEDDPIRCLCQVKLYLNEHFSVQFLEEYRCFKTICYVHISSGVTGKWWPYIRHCKKT